MITIQNPDLIFLLADLERFEYLQLSQQPDVPGKDELINHRLIGKQVIETKKGLILVLELENMDTGEKYNYSYPDIINVEMNNNWSEHMVKYYLTCINREKEYEINQLMEHQRLGVKLDRKELELITEGYTNIYRILCLNSRK